MTQSKFIHYLKQKNINPNVFLSASAMIAAIIAVAVIAPKWADGALKSLQAAIVNNGSWYYILTVAVILITTVYLSLSRYGNIKLGLDHSKPEYSDFSWFAMLFSAGMGIGLMFFGVAEPVMHFLSPPLGEGGNVQAAREAMRLTFFHWGLHAWAIYAIVALILAYFAYRHHLPLTLRSALYPLIGERIYGKWGDAVDVFAVVGTLFGVATSLGYGVLQVNTGLNYLLPNLIQVNIPTQIVLIIVVSGLATLSVTSGLDKGVKFLSELNIGLAVLLLLFVLLTGSTVFLLQAFVQNVGTYASNIVGMTFNMYAYQKTDWFGGWTILYWGWWLSWSPFVGLFIAKVSRGRTIREFVAGVLLVPTGFTFLWMTVFGNSAIDMILNRGITQLGDVVNKDVSLALFAMFEHLPMSGILMTIALLMVVVFFVTSADSGALVMDMLCANGEGSKGLMYRIFWSSSAGLVAIVLLLAGGLGALQTMTIASALPFVTVLMVATYGLMKALRVDAEKLEVQQLSLTTPLPAMGSGAWRERLRVMMDYPNRERVAQFIDDTVQAACKDVAAELANNGVKADVMAESGRVSLLIYQGDKVDFIYKVKAIGHIRPEFASPSMTESHAPEEQKYYRAEVYLTQGGQDYDIMAWTKEGVINDIIQQYHTHMHFLHRIR
ncbi:Glycine betaine transporter BetP [Alysiella crassa]|uniref:Glycine betaine transporter BetP n=2 Tax=Alysiella crassa TaxID=153491 RepID=A0A376BM47_9NEIS|nr:Glycine betaine transporter BetP [Alysiella crassa]